MSCTFIISTQELLNVLCSESFRMYVLGAFATVANIFFLSFQTLHLEVCRYYTSLHIKACSE